MPCAFLFYISYFIDIGEVIIKKTKNMHNILANQITVIYTGLVISFQADVLYRLSQPIPSHQEPLSLEELEEVNKCYAEWKEELACGKVISCYT